MKITFDKVAVLAGGTSCEREISLISGQAVYDALRSKGISAVLIDPKGDFIAQLRKLKVTMVFIALHGSFGEDGTVQRLLEEAAIPYTGCGARASQLAFDKAESQEYFYETGILVPEFKVIQKGENAANPASQVGYPLVVKPSQSGSSVGISIVASESQLSGAVQEAFKFSETVLLEQYIAGRELTVGILGRETLPVVEVIAKRQFYDYKAKYSDAGTQYEVPASLSPLQVKRISRTALKAFDCLKCQVMARVDMILSQDGKAYVLEINTVPGLTGKSLLPKAARAAGIDFPDLCVRILELSRECHRPLRRA